MYFVTFSIILFQAPYLRRTTQPARARLGHHPACGAEQDLERRTGVGQRLEEVGRAVGTRGWQSHGWQHGRSVSWGPEEQDKCPDNVQGLGELRLLRVGALDGRDTALLGETGTKISAWLRIQVK